MRDFVVSYDRYSMCNATCFHSSTLPTMICVFQGESGDCASWWITREGKGIG